jgi:hypothetical protein
MKSVCGRHSLSHPYVFKALTYNKESAGLPNVLKALAALQTHIYSNCSAPILLKAFASLHVIILVETVYFRSIPVVKQHHLHVITST